MIDNTIVGFAITQLRKKQNLTQKELADKLNISDKAISKWERGLGLPDISLLSTLAMALDSDVESLLHGNIDYKKENWQAVINFSYSKIDLKTKINNKSILSYQIGYCMLSGIDDISIICNKFDYDFIKNEVKGINIKIAFINNINEISNVNTMYICSPLFIYGQNLTRSFQAAMVRKEGMTVLSLPENEIENVSIHYDSNHKVTSSADNSIETAYKYNAIPIMFVPKNQLTRINDKEFNLLINNLVDGDCLYTEPMFRGLIYIPLNNKDDIDDCEKLVKIIEKRDTEIGNLKEIELRRGFR